MKLFFFAFYVLLNFSALAQDEIHQPFDSPIIAYFGLGFYIAKEPNKVIVESRELLFAEDSTHFIVITANSDENFLILGEVQNGDTINKQRFEFQFIPVGRPVLKWKCQDEYDDPHRVVLHKDSLEELREFELRSWRKTTPPVEWKLLDCEVLYSGLKSRPHWFKTTSIPTEVIDSLSLLGDTFQIYFVMTVSMQDGIRRKMVDSAEIILLEGKAYEKHIDPQYDFKHYKDTVYINREQLERNDTIVLHNRGHLYIGFPKMKYDYEILIDPSYTCLELDVFTKVPKGKGYFIYDAWNLTGIQTLRMRFDKGEKSKKIRIEKIEVP